MLNLKLWTKRSKLPFPAKFFEHLFEMYSADEAPSLRFFFAGGPALCRFALSCRFEVSAVPTQKPKHSRWCFIMPYFPCTKVFMQPSIFRISPSLQHFRAPRAFRRKCDELRAMRCRQHGLTAKDWAHSVAAGPRRRMCSVHGRNYPLY